MRFGLIADTHFNNWQAFGRCHTDGISSRLLKQRDNFLQAMSVFKREHVDCVIHGGDWGHTVGSISNEVLNISRELLKDIWVPIVFVCGNHDTPVRVDPKSHHLLTNVLQEFRMRSSGAETNRLLNNMEIDRRVRLINFQDDINYDDVVGYDLVVLHKTPVGARLGNYTFGEGANWRRLASKNKFVAFGHIHQMQKMSENCFIMGSPMPLTFGDDGRRGVWIVDTGRPAELPDIDPGDPGSLKFIKLDYPEFITVDSPDKIKDDGNYYKLLGTRLKVENENVVSVVVPEVFKERIKSQDFHNIIREWMELNGKDESYLKLITDILEEKMTLVKEFYKGRLWRVEIKNFLSVGDVTYHVPPTGFTLVSGDSESFSSNGSGKTSVIGEPICWALFGETTKGLTGDDVIRNRPDQQKDCKVTLSLGGEVPVVVSRSRKDGLVVLQDGREITDGMLQDARQALLESILGFDKGVFLASVYFSQKNLLMLAEMSDAEKTNMVTDLLGFSRYDDLQKKVLGKVHQFEAKIQSNEKVKVGLEKDLAVFKEKFSNLERSIEEKDHRLLDFANSIKGYKDRLSELQRERVVEEVFEKVDYNSKIKEFGELGETFNKMIEAVREILDAVNEEHCKVAVKISALNMEMGANKISRSKLLAEIENLRSETVGVRCEKCGAIVTGANIEAFVKEREVQLTKLGEELFILGASLHTQEDLLKEISLQRTQLEAKEMGFCSERSKINGKQSELHELRNAQIAKEREGAVRRERIQGDINKYTAFITNDSEKMESLKKEKVTLINDRIKLAETTVSLEEGIKATNDLMEGTRIDIEKLGWWQIAFSPKGIRAVLLDRFCNDINATINGYLSTVSGGTMSIMITPTKTTKKGEERNKIGLSIQINGKEAVYAGLSGGEQRRVDVSLCFGLNKFVSDKYQVPSGVLGLIILDEVFSFLDKSGEEAVAELLCNEGKIRNVFVIDHALNLSSYADRTWLVEKRGDISFMGTQKDDYGTQHKEVTEATPQQV